MRDRTVMKGEILVLAHTPNEAKQIESHLRSVGHSVHLLVAPGLDSFIDILEKSDICIAIHDAAFQDCDLIQVVEAVNRSKPKLPILQLSPHIDSRAVTEAMAKGARGLLSLSNPSHLEMVLQREYEYFQMLGKLRDLEEKIHQLEDVRTQDLGTTSAPGLRIQEGIVVHANLALAVALNYTDPDDLIGVPLMDLVDPQDQEKIKKIVKDCSKNRSGEESVSFVLRGENGAVRKLEARLIPIEHEGEPALEIRGLESMSFASGDNGGGSGFARQALYQAIGDRTAVANSDNLVCLSFISIDEYDQIEQRVGYAGAEQVVEQTIKLLQNDILDSDQVFRFSLSEMALLVKRDSLDAVRDLLQHFQRGISRHIFNAANKEVSCTLSIVVNPMDSAPEDSEALIRKLRERNQEQQKAGGNQLTMAGNAARDAEQKARNQAWVEQIKKALDDNRFDLAYQNIASLAGEERQYSDILLRMIDEDGKELLAREFLPTAEDNGLMPSIDRWVIQRAAEVIEEQLKQKKDPCFFIRVAEATLEEGDAFVNWLEKFWQEHPKLKSHMVLVIRELHLQDHMKRALNLTNKAHKLGIGTALDHFGSNHQSHQLLSRLKLDYVKLHADFTQAISGQGDNELLQIIMEQARINGVKTIAERVADANSMARLWQLGVNYIMGSHVHEPERELTRTSFRLQ